MMRLVAARWVERTGGGEVAAYDRALDTGGPLPGAGLPRPPPPRPRAPPHAAGGPLQGAAPPATPAAGRAEPVKVEDRVLAGFGWQRDDVKLVQQMASNGAEPIGSLGYDGPLAALSPARQHLGGYFQETVAVVTNPALDRERELEHFSTRTLFGRRPSPDN